MALTLERRNQQDKTITVSSGDAAVLLAPVLGDDYWTYRVCLTEANAVVGFPKFGTIGIGFAVEEDRNTNLPYLRCSTEEIVEHIWRNRGDERITKEMVTQAVDMIRAAAAADLGTELKR